jgi:hypothetical protein
MTTGMSCHDDWDSTSASMRTGIIPAALNVDRSAPPPNRHGGRRPANHAFVFACKRRGCRPEPVPGLDPGGGMTNGAIRRVGINGRWNYMKRLADPTRFERATFAFGGLFSGFEASCRDLKWRYKPLI